MLRKAGFNVNASSRSYIPRVDDPEIEARLIRAQEISRYVEHGMLDVGITGYDWVCENGSDVVEVQDMVYGKQGRKPVRWVLAVPNDSSISSVKDLQGKRIATEAVGLTKRYLEKNGVDAEVEFSWGATEVKVPELVDAIVEITETGSSLKANNLRIVETVMESVTKVIANKTAWENEWKKQKIQQVAMLLEAALCAESTALLKLNVHQDNLDAVTKILPALHAPTVNNLSSDGWYSVESVVEEPVVRDIIPQLKAAGAEGIIEVALNKVVP